LNRIRKQQQKLLTMPKLNLQKPSRFSQMFQRKSASHPFRASESLETKQEPAAKAVEAADVPKTVIK
jgi:hypothetical protein